MPKITLIGAGSKTFATNLIGDLLSFDELADSTIALMDVDEERLRRTAAIADRMADAEDSVDPTIKETTDRREALDGAEYVFTTIYVGDLEYFENEIRIPERYGVNQAVGDIIGPSGVFAGFKQIPALREVVSDMEELCPGAPLFNYTNPLSIICIALEEVSDIDVYGLCHSVQGTARQLAAYLDVPPAEIEYWVAGINHMAWFLELEHGGTDLYPKLHDAMDDPDVYAKDSVRFEILRHFGAFVTESSSHMSEYVPYFRTDEETVSELVAEADQSSYSVSWLENGSYLDARREAQAEEVDVDDVEPSIERSNEYGARIVHSMETGTERRMNINVPNDPRTITNLPAEACVEVPCLVDDRGIHPCTVGKLPPQLAALNRTNVNVHELAAKAALEEDRTTAYRAVQLDPLTGAALSLGEIRDMCDDLFEANRAVIPDGFYS